jgi:hypothetical protein
MDKLQKLLHDYSSIESEVNFYTDYRSLFLTDGGQCVEIENKVARKMMDIEIKGKFHFHF